MTRDTVAADTPAFQMDKAKEAAEQMKDWAAMLDIEFVHITKDTTVESLEHDLFLSDLAWKLK